MHHTLSTGLVLLLSVGVCACDGRAVGKLHPPAPGGTPAKSAASPQVVDGGSRDHAWDPPPTVTAPDLAVDGPATPPVVPPDAKTTTCVFLNAPTSQNNCAAVDGPTAPAECWGVGSCQTVVQAPADTELLWKSSCGGYAYSRADDIADTVGFDCGAEAILEEVTCLFGQSDGMTKQWCTTSGVPGPFRCSGFTKCTVLVLTTPGQKLSWSSSCAGTHQTTLNGTTKTLSFTCP